MQPGRTSDEGVIGPSESAQGTEKKNNVFYDGVYAPSGFDVMKALIRVATRPNPQINLGAVDCNAAIVVCDPLQHDTPIIYCSEAVSHLTGYSEAEILGRNCRFLQSSYQIDQQRQPHQAPGQDKTDTSDAPWQPPKAAGASRNANEAIDPQRELSRLRSSLRSAREVQVILQNYTRDGVPFKNLVTVIPVRWDSGSETPRYLVGFLAKAPTFPTVDVPISTPNPSLA